MDIFLQISSVCKAILIKVWYYIGIDKQINEIEYTAQEHTQYYGYLL